jgi:DNA-binding transcriptional MerR regulator
MRTVSIGDFARMTHLSVKTLRHYHDVGLLVPAEIDAATGYRYYARAQVAVAQVIRRFRDIDMPLDEVRALLAAPTPDARNSIIRAHVGRLRSKLDETQASLGALHTILDPPTSSLEIEHRRVEETWALAIAETVSLPGFSTWWLAAFTEIRAALGSLGVKATGPEGGLFETELFSEERGEVVLFVPVRGRVGGVGRTTSRVIPATELAIVRHHGNHSDIDRAYGALGTHVAEHEIGVEGPIREHYLCSRLATTDESRWLTEIGWPIFQSGAARV